MTERPHNEECAAVRDALLSGSFVQVSREQVEQHLAGHAACVQWAAQTLLLSHLLAMEQQRHPPHGQLDDAALEAYLDGSLPDPHRRAVEDACCRDLELAARLEHLRERRWERRVRVIDPGLAAPLLQVIQAVPPPEGAALVARLEDFSSLYVSKPLAVAASQAQRSLFQTPDGNLVVSVVDKGPQLASGPHLIELGIRVHQSQWIGRWACYRVTDAQGSLAAAGLVKLDANGSSVRVTVPPTEHAPYSVQVEVLDVETERLQVMFEQIAAQRNPGRAT
jgi:anti-sigma factor RsiW